MKRPIFIIALGCIFGILMGLYFNIVSYFFTILLILLLKILMKRKLKIARICKIFLTKSIIITFILSTSLSNIYTKYCNNMYEEIYKKSLKCKFTAIVISSKKEGNYSNTYLIKIKNNENNAIYNNKIFLLKISKSRDIGLSYGDKIDFLGEYIRPEVARNYKGFDYSKYLKSQKIFGTFKIENVKVIDKNNVSFMENVSYNVKCRIINNIREILPANTRELFLGILIGYNDNLQEEIKMNFSRSSLSHLLAVSGAHVACIVMGLIFIFKKLKLSKPIRNTLVIIFLIFFMYITDFASSVVRAAIMGIISLIPTLIYRKKDIKTSISIPLILILIYNPYKILDIGLVLSYMATIGIIISNKIYNKSCSKAKNKIFIYLKEIILITLFANIFVIPIIIYNFNTISLTFIISNLVAGVLIEPITIGGLLIIVLSFLDIKIACLISVPYNILLRILDFTSKIVSKISFSQIIVPTPNIFVIFLYYVIILFLFISIYFIKQYNNRFLIKKLMKIYTTCFEIFKINIKKNLIIFCALLVIIQLLKTIPRDLKIYFIDVGQGDSSLVITPTNKKVLIDGGGVEIGNYDVGKNILFPYLLDRQITNIDYVFISHFDTDHCGGLIYVLKNMKVKNIVIAKQFEYSDNYNEILTIAKNKKIKIYKVVAEQKIRIDKNVYFDILWPNSREAINENVLNNNSMVCKLTYKSFSMMFTGDIEKVAEESILKKYKNNKKMLNADVLKIAHHGSKTSSTMEFIEAVSPKYAVIGVGKDNKFGHPSDITIKNLKSKEISIYRTDMMGEITMKVNKQKGILIGKMIN